MLCVLTNLVRAGVARVTNNAYAPWPTAYDAFFPNGTWLTKPTRPAEASHESGARRADAPTPEENP